MGEIDNSQMLYALHMHTTSASSWETRAALMLRMVVSLIESHRVRFPKRLVRG